MSNSGVHAALSACTGVRRVVILLGQSRSEVTRSTSSLSRSGWSQDVDCLVFRKTRLKVR